MTEFEFFSLKDTAEQEAAAMSFKEKVEWLGKWIRDNYNFISVNTLYRLFFNNYGWDKYKIRYAIQLLSDWELLFQVGANTFVVNKNFKIGKFSNKPVFATKGKFFSKKELERMFPNALVFLEAVELLGK